MTGADNKIDARSNRTPTLCGSSVQEYTGALAPLDSLVIPGLVVGPALHLGFPASTLPKVVSRPLVIAGFCPATVIGKLGGKGGLACCPGREDDTEIV